MCSVKSELSKASGKVSFDDDPHPRSPMQALDSSTSGTCQAFRPHLILHHPAPSSSDVWRSMQWLGSREETSTLSRRKYAGRLLLTIYRFFASQPSPPQQWQSSSSLVSAFAFLGWHSLSRTALALIQIPSLTLLELILGLFVMAGITI